MKRLIFLLLLVNNCFGCDVDGAPKWVCFPPNNCAVGFDKYVEKMAVAKAKVELAKMKKTEVNISFYSKVSSDGGTQSTKESSHISQIEDNYILLYKWVDQNGYTYVLVTVKN